MTFLQMRPQIFWLAQKCVCSIDLDITIFFMNKYFKRHVSELVSFVMSVTDFKEQRSYVSDETK